MNGRATASVAPGAPDRGAPGLSADPAGILEQVMSVAGLGILEISQGSAALIAFRSGSADSGLVFEPAQVAPGTPWTDNVYPQDRDNVRAHLQLGSEAAAPAAIEYRVIVGDGELLWVRHWTLSRHGIGDEAWTRAMIMPIREEKHLEWECLRVSERECNRIGQELHDDLCQVLAGLVFMLRVVGQRARRVDATLADEIDELNTHVSGATDRVRSMAHGLFPAQLKFTTLNDALTAFAAEARTLFRIDVIVDLPPTLPRHHPEQLVHVYRIVQESVSNAVRHGRASVVTISVGAGDKGLYVRIDDNGTGFPAAAAQPEGIGMHVMQYRARVLGGEFSVRNLLPHGVTAELRYPIACTVSQPSSTHTSSENSNLHR